MICIAAIFVTNDVFSTANPIYPTLFRGETPVHYFPPEEKLPPKLEPAPTYQSTPSYQPDTQYTPSQSFGPYSIHHYQPSYKSTLVDNNTPIYQYSEPYPFEYDLAYEHNNVFRAAPPYQSNYNKPIHESFLNYQQDYTGFDDYSGFNSPQNYVHFTVY